MSFLRDKRASIAIEFAILMPVVLIALGQGVVIFQMMALNQNVTFVAQAAAMAGRAALAAGGSPEDAAGRVQAVAAANAILFNGVTTVDAPVITYTADGLICVTIGATADAFFPMFTPTVHSEFTATT